MFSREGGEDPGLLLNEAGPGCVVVGGGGHIRLVAAPGGGNEDRGQSAHRVVVEKKGAKGGLCGWWLEHYKRD